jgi:hypothetical protein
MKVGDIINALVRLDELVDNITPRGEIHLKQYEAIIIGLFSNLRGLYKAIIQLLAKEMATESEIVIRSLLIASLQLMYLERNPDQRIALVCGWLNRNNLDIRNTIEEAISIGMEKEPYKMKTILKEREIKLRNWSDEMNVSKYLNFPSEKQMAKELDKSMAYLNFKILSETVHISPMTYKKRMKTTDGIQYPISYRNDINDIHVMAIEALEWFLAGAVSTGKMFRWEGLSKIESLGSDGEDIYKSISK